MDNFNAVDGVVVETGAGVAGANTYVSPNEVLEQLQPLLPPDLDYIGTLVNCMLRAHMDLRAYMGDHPLYRTDSIYLTHPLTTTPGVPVQLKQASILMTGAMLLVQAEPTVAKEVGIDGLFKVTLSPGSSPTVRLASQLTERARGLVAPLKGSSSSSQGRFSYV